MSDEAESSKSFDRSGEAAVRDALSRIDPDSFDWQAYEGTYHGRALITRLIHIPKIILATPHPSPASLEVARTALLRAIPLIRKTLDVALYHQAVAQIESILMSTQASGPSGLAIADDDASAKDGGMDVDGRKSEAEGVPDMEWVEAAEAEERKEHGRLEVERTGYMSNLIKESIRLTYFAFAQLYRRSGNLGEAMSSYVAAREYSTAPSHHVDLGVGIIDALLAFNARSSLQGHISKLDAALERAYPLAPTATSRRAGGEGDSASLTAADIRDKREKEAHSAAVRRSVGVKIRVAHGLLHLNSGNYAEAGREFGEVGEDGGLTGWEGDAISTSDLALLTAVCTLATANRDRIRRVLLDRTFFRSAVDDSNRWLLDLVQSYMDADYVKVMSLLALAEPHLLLNPFIGTAAGTILDLIRSRAMVQYVAPFSSVSISTMGEAFGMTREAMIAEVEKLVERGLVKGRIDLIDKVLDVRSPNLRSKMIKHAYETGRTTTEATAAALVRMRMHEAGILVDPRTIDQDSGDDVEADQLGAPDGLNLPVDEAVGQEKAEA